METGSNKNVRMNKNFVRNKNKRYHTTAVSKSVSQYTAQQRVAVVKKFPKVSELTFDSLPASGIGVMSRWWYLNAGG